MKLSTTAKIYDKTQKKLNSLVGTAYYIAPEVVKKSYNEKCDVWSIGVILCILLSGEPPFNGETDDDIISEVKKGKYDIESGIWTKISSDAKELVKQLLTYDYKQRGSAYNALQHKWFKNATNVKVDQAQMEETLKALSKFSAV